ncbi:MAG TPA: hypothetical protein VGO96_03475 [Pyrinomonadaceae bacterium]|nr:hypothetical protein [Pyrinomonadaceae bacterium]
MKRCGVCGREYADEARFCGEDGTPLKASEQTASADNMAAYDALARAARESGGARTALDALWGAVYRLPSWLFLLRGDNMIPISCVIDGRSSVMAFTDHPALQRFSQLQGYNSDDDYSAMLLTVENASEMLLGLRSRGAETLLFNHGGEGFSLPLENLPGLYHYFNGRELPSVARARSDDDFGKVNPGYAELDKL